MDRKEFIKRSGAAALLLSMGVLLESCSDDSEEVLPDNNNPGQTVQFDLGTAPFDALSTVDAWMLHPQRNILLVNVNGTIRAFTSVCPHAGCNNSWSYTNQIFICSCHDSRFNNQGVVTQGPATRNLREFNVSVDGTEVIIQI